MRLEITDGMGYNGWERGDICRLGYFIQRHYVTSYCLLKSVNKMPPERKFSFHKKQNQSSLGAMLKVAFVFFCLTVTVANGELDEGKAARAPPTAFIAERACLCARMLIPSIGDAVSASKVGFGHDDLAENRNEAPAKMRPRSSWEAAVRAIALQGCHTEREYIHFEN